METRKVQVAAMLDKISAAGNPYNTFTFCSDTNATLKDKIVPREYQELCVSALKSTSWLTIEIEKKPGLQPGYTFINILKVYPYVAPPMSPVEGQSDHMQSTPVPSKSTPPIVDSFNQDDIRTRSMVLAYAKDLVVAGKVDYKDLKMVAEGMYLYVTSGKLVIPGEI